MSIKTMIQKWLGIEPPKQRISAARAYQAPIQNTYQPTMERLPYQTTPQHTQPVVGFSYGKHYAKSYVQMYAAHSFEAWDRILQIRRAVAIHHRKKTNEYELRITDFDRHRYGMNKSCLTKTFANVDRCVAFKNGLIGKHNTERSLRGLQPLDPTLFKSKYD